MSGMEKDLTLLRLAMEAMDCGVVVLGRGGSVRLISPQAAQWIAKYFGPSSQSDRLPDALQRRIEQQVEPPAVQSDVSACSRPMVVEREDKKLAVRFVFDRNDGLMILEEKQSGFSKRVLMDRFGLTEREVEVVHWVTQGKTNTEIGIILETSPRTVGKHLEHIYQKIGVETRTAATNMLFSGLDSTADA